MVPIIIMVKKKVRGSTNDIISNLPSDIIENILMCLPIRDAVRTSVLSSKWRNNWVELPQLLTHLNLLTCVFNPPPTFEGFSRLTSLEFYEVRICADALASLISSCPLLDQLTLKSSAILDYLEIVAPNLKFLCFVGVFKTVRLLNTPHLAIASINLKQPIDGEVFKGGGTFNIIKLCDSVSVENQDIEYYYVKSLAAGGIPERLPTTADRLKVLKFPHIYFGELDEVAFVLLLIRSCPNLQKVTIGVTCEVFLYFGTVVDTYITDAVLEFLNEQGYSDDSWNQLREVEMRSICGMKNEMAFIKFLLSKSPVLEKMLIESHKEVAHLGLGILEEVKRLPCASPNAEITYKDPNESSSSTSTFAPKFTVPITIMAKEEVRGSTSDIISNLPGSVIENILMCLPMQDAVRTSVLSSKWRYNWVKLPQLVFDDMFCKKLGENQLSTENKLLMNIYQVLLLHHGPILKFTLSISGLESCSEIDQFILFVSRNGVQEFSLRIWKGFSRLTSLVFDEVLICADILASLISSCPLLDQLTLRSSAILDHLEIAAPNLKFLCIVALFKNVRFINTPLLAIASFELKQPIDEQVFKVGGTSNMIKLFDSLPVETLHLTYHYAKSLAAGGILKRLPTTLDQLKILKLSYICFEELEEVACALLLIKSSPNLQKVKIVAFAGTDSVTDTVLEFLNAQGYSDVSWNQLREVEMQCISGMKNELGFIKLLLAKSPMLESMLIEPNSKVDADKGFRILKEVIRFPRASPKAEITYKD
ncbi:hypothetical protein F0562_033953 [Nyssa sinensis]|uniref:F-box domain-containing protein n=1 Tax=Nyssa sinensis TaxID=561372 RepID=A0A5J5AGE8_9ASTE|nr:hypothetical protein F0562_033953 [Nyssa sinensis]